MSKGERNTMRCLTLTVPWALLLFCPDADLRKTWETRSWSTPYRGRLAIHAGKGLAGMKESEMWQLALSEPFRAALQALGYMNPGRLLRGVVLGTVDLIDIKSTFRVAGTISQVERAFGDYSEGRWAWQLSNPVLFETPIPARGARRLWEWTPPPAGVVGERAAA